jgi:hypothetical protein
MSGYIYRKAARGERSIELTRRPLLTKQVTLKVQLNDKVVCCTKLGKTQRMISLLYDAFKVMRVIVC